VRVSVGTERKRLLQLEEYSDYRAANIKSVLLLGEEINKAREN
jgi:hypothetical protein